MERELTRLSLELELPQGGGPVWFYPGATTLGGRNGMLLRVLDGDGDTRICMVASRQEDVPFSGPIELPDNEHFYANGLLISYDDPDVCEPVGVWPVLDGRWTPSQDVIVFHDHVSAVAYGPSGRMWTSGRLVLDGLEVQNISEEVVCFAGYAYSDTDIAVKSQRVMLRISNGKAVEALARQREEI